MTPPHSTSVPLLWSTATRKLLLLSHCYIVLSIGQVGLSGLDLFKLELEQNIRMGGGGEGVESAGWVDPGKFWKVLESFNVTIMDPGKFGKF